jgi:hypothetical protein
MLAAILVCGLGYLPRHDRANLAETNFCEHPVEACTRYAGYGSTQVVIHDIDLAPAQSNQAVAHGILQCAALAIVQNLMG